MKDPQTVNKFGGYCHKTFKYHESQFMINIKLASFFRVLARDVRMEK